MEEIINVGRGSGGHQTTPNNRKLDTNGCCFLCLRVVEFKSENNEEKEEDKVNEESTSTKAKDYCQSVSLKSLRRYLKIDTKKLPGGSTATSSVNITGDDPSEAESFLKKEEDDIKVGLCDTCARIVKKFSSVFATLEMIKVEINYWVEEIHQRIPDGVNDSSELVQNYCRRMANQNDAEKKDLFMLIDELRIEIAKKCSKLKNNLEASVKLDRADVPMEACSSSLVLPITDEFESEPSSPPPMSMSSVDQSISQSSPESKAALELELEGEEDCNEYIPESEDEELEEYKEEEDEKEIEADLTDFERRTSSPDPLFFPEPDEDEDESADSFSMHQPGPSSIASTSAAPRRRRYQVSTPECSIYDPKTGKYKCFLCDKSYNSYSSCWVHYDVNHNNRTHTCQICNVAVFKRKQSLRDHEKTCLQKLQQQKQERFLASEEAEGEEAEEMEVIIKTEASKDIIIAHQQRPPPKKYNKIQGCTFNPETRKWVCQLCFKEFSIKSSFRQHYNIEHLKIRHKCEYCEETFTQPAHLRRHMERKHGIISKPSTPPPKPKLFKFNPETKKYKCLACPKEFKWKGGVYNHFHAFHRQGQPLLKCDICNEAEFREYPSLSNHQINCQQRLDREKEKEIDPDYKYKCPSCGKKFKLQISMKYHQKRVHEDKAEDKELAKHACDLCERRFNSKYRLRGHKEVTHFGIRPSCKICSKVFNNERTRECHVLKCKKMNPDHPSVLEEEKEKIAKKLERLSLPPKLEIEMNPETGKFDCPVPTCQKSYNAAVSVRVHIGRTHVKLDKSHLCDLCGASFTKNDQLNAHKKKCTGEQRVRKKKVAHKRIAFLKARDERLLQAAKIRDSDPKKYKFSCATCGFKFTRLYSLQQHERRVHQNMKDYQCDICEVKLKSFSSLKQHKEVLHYGKLYICKFCKKEYRTPEYHQNHEEKCEMQLPVPVTDGQTE